VHYDITMTVSRTAPLLVTGHMYLIAYAEYGYCELIALNVLSRDVGCVGEDGTEVQCSFVALQSRHHKSPPECNARSRANLLKSHCTSSPACEVGLFLKPVTNVHREPEFRQLATLKTLLPVYFLYVHITLRRRSATSACTWQCCVFC